MSTPNNLNDGAAFNSAGETVAKGLESLANMIPQNQEESGTSFNTSGLGGNSLFDNGGIQAQDALSGFSGLSQSSINGGFERGGFSPSLPSSPSFSAPEQSSLIQSILPQGLNESAGFGQPQSGNSEQEAAYQGSATFFSSSGKSNLDIKESQEAASQSVPAPARTFQVGNTQGDNHSEAPTPGSSFSVNGNESYFLGEQRPGGTFVFDEGRPNKSGDDPERFSVGNTAHGVKGVDVSGIGRSAMDMAKSSLDETDTVKGYREAKKVLGLTGITGVTRAADAYSVRSALNKDNRKFEVSKELGSTFSVVDLAAPGNHRGKTVQVERASSADMQAIFMSQGIPGASSYRMNTGNIVSDFYRDYGMINKYLQRKGIHIEDTVLIKKRIENLLKAKNMGGKFTVADANDLKMLQEALVFAENKKKVDNLPRGGAGKVKNALGTIVQDSDVMQGYRTVSTPYRVAKGAAKLTSSLAGASVSLLGAPARVTGVASSAGAKVIDNVVLRKYSVNSAEYKKWAAKSKALTDRKTKAFEIAGKNQRKANIISHPIKSAKNAIRSRVSAAFGKTILGKKFNAANLALSQLRKKIASTMIVKIVGTPFKILSAFKSFFLFIAKFLLIVAGVDMLFLLAYGLITMSGVSIDSSLQTGASSDSYNQYASNQMYALQYAHQNNMGNAMLMDGYNGTYEYYIDSNMIASADIEEKDKELLDSFTVYADEVNTKFGKNAKKKMLHLRLSLPVILEGIPKSWKDQLNGQLAATGEKGATAEKFVTADGTKGSYKMNISEGEDYYASIFESDIGTAIYTKNGREACEPNYDDLKGIDLHHYWGPPVCAYTGYIPSTSKKCHIRHDVEHKDSSGHTYYTDEPSDTWHWCGRHGGESITITGPGGLEGYIGSYDIDANEDTAHGNPSPNHNKKAIYAANTCGDYIFVQHDSAGYKNLGNKKNPNVKIRYIYTGSAYSYAYTETKYFTWQGSNGKKHKYNIKNMYKAINTMAMALADNSITHYTEDVGENELDKNQRYAFEAKNKYFIKEFTERLYWQAIDGYHAIGANSDVIKPNTRILLKTEFKKNDAMKVTFDVFEETSMTSRDHVDEEGNPAMIKQEHPTRIGEDPGTEVTSYDAYVYLDIVMSCTGLQDLVNIDSGYNWDGSKPSGYNIHNNGGYGKFSTEEFVKGNLNTVSDEKRGPLTTPDWCAGEKDCLGHTGTSHGSQYFHSNGQGEDDEERIEGKFEFNWGGWYDDEHSCKELKSMTYNPKLKDSKDGVAPSRALEQVLTYYEQSNATWEDLTPGLIIPDRPTDIDDLESMADSDYEYLFAEGVLPTLNPEMTPEELARLLEDMPNLSPMLMQLLSQGDSRIAGLLLGNSGETVQQSGCLITSLAMIASIFKAGSAVDFVKMIAGNSANFNENAWANTPRILNSLGLQRTASSGVGAAPTIAAIKQQLSLGRPLVLHIEGHNDGGPNSIYHRSNKGHFLVVTGCTPQGFYINDPGSKANAGKLINWSDLNNFTNVYAYGVYE